MIQNVFRRVLSKKTVLFGPIQLFFNKSIGRKIIVLFVPLIIMVTIGIFFVSYYKFSDTLEKQVIDATSRIIDQVGKNTDFYFKDIMTPMAMLVQKHIHTQCLKRL